MKIYDVLIIGAGPAGLFSAYDLMKEKDVAIIYEGRRIANHRGCTDKKRCHLCKSCDILHGEGGAGGFSDGKMTLSLGRGTQNEVVFDKEDEKALETIRQSIKDSGVKYKEFYEGKIDEKLQEELDREGLNFTTYDLIHFGSEGSRQYIEFLYDRLVAGGVDIFEDHKALDVKHLEDGSYEIISSDQVFKAKKVIFATGCSGGSFANAQISKLGGKFNDKASGGIGLRIEVPREVTQPVFDEFYDWKIETEIDGISYRSFCANDGGIVVKENHRNEGIVGVNGHSFLNEESRTDRSNFSIVSKISHGDEMIGEIPPKEWVLIMARMINSLSPNVPAVQTTMDFVMKSDKQHKPKVRTEKDTRWRKIHSVLPEKLYKGFKDYLVSLDIIYPGVVSNESLIYAPEPKYWVRQMVINEGWTVEGTPEGIYVIGTSSGHTNSFVASALTGIACAKHILNE